MTLLRRRRRIVLAALAAVGIASIVLPAFGDDAPAEVRLHVANGVATFQYGATVQTISTARNGCQITSAETIIDLGALGSGSVQPGFASDSLGVKSSGSNANGTPCSQINSVETLTIAPAADGVITGRSFQKIQLDVEMTGNAVVRLTLAGNGSSQLYQLQTGTSIDPVQAAEPDYDLTAPYTVSSGPGDVVDACAAPNSSGPNSGANDNCIWTVEPGFDFTSVSLTTSIGTVSLEGGSDHGGAAEFDTILTLSNSAPVATDDSFDTPEDTTLTGDVLTNDTDADGDTLEATLVTGTANGSLSLATDGSFTYQPNENYFGTDSFTYQATDGAEFDTATATITITPVNDPPVAVNGTATTDEDTTATITVATDVDSAIIEADCTTDKGGSAVDNGDGTVTYTPARNFNGTETLTCTVTDDQGATAEVQTVITVAVDPVNDAPIANDDSAETNEDVPEFDQDPATTSVAIDVLGNDEDVDGDPLQVDSVTQPANGTAVIDAGGTVTYTPDPGFVGTDTFTYVAFDGQALSSPATVTVTVFQVLCSTKTVTATDGDVNGSFTRLSDPLECKRFVLTASELDEEVIFQPEGEGTVTYRGLIELGPDPAPVDGIAPVGLEYDPDGPDGAGGYQPLLWCENPVFDAENQVTGATIPLGETWCLASAFTRGTGVEILTTYQVYGRDDPGFAKPR